MRHADISTTVNVFTQADYEPSRQEASVDIRGQLDRRVVAGAGFEPATFGL